VGVTEVRDAPARTRDPHLDNIKAVLVVLVVVGHGIEALRGRVPEGLYVAIYSFHMPAFVLLSGYLSRSWKPDPAHLRALATGLLAPFVLFQVLLAAELAIIAGVRFPGDLLLPRGATWFLLALAWWRLGVPLMRLLRRPALLVLALAASVMAPIDQNLDSLAALGRTVGFLPFFALGMVLPSAVFAWLGRLVSRICGVAVLTGLLVAGLAWGWKADRGWLYLRSHYHAVDGTVESVLIRLAVLAIGLIGSAAIAAVVSRRQCWFTVVGANSLTVYLAHLPVMLAARHLEPLKGLVRGQGTIAITVGVVLVAVGVALTLGSRPVSRMIGFLVTPHWLTRPLLR
jgi:fucose 4-O-acetylase-like acetyltransferase